MAGKLHDSDEIVQLAQSRKNEALTKGNYNAYRAWMIRAARLSAKISQEQLAKLMKTSQPQIARLESAEYEGQQLSTLRDVAQALGMQFVPPRIESRKPRTNKSHPPIILSFTPGADEIVEQIQPPFKDEAKRRLEQFPFFSVHGDDVQMATAKGNLKLTDPDSRQLLSQFGQGQYWEMMNISEFLFNWNIDPDAKPILEIETSHFDIEFFDHEGCYEFLSEVAGKWEAWGKEGGV